jgi:pyridoxamine 5'-phosphate oxidase
MPDFKRRTRPVSLATLRRSYEAGDLSEESVHPDPIQQFNRWFEDAQAAELIEPNAMVLATSTADGRPSARVVLLKEFGNDGFVFYTNYLSRKGRELGANPIAALTFYWAELERQVRIEGTVRQTERGGSEEYFRSRPRDSQLGAWVSQQSDVVSSRENIEGTLRHLQERFASTDPLPVPEHWGGYRVEPQLLEFWQGRPNRLHDRLVYRKSGDAWILERLWP